MAVTMKDYLPASVNTWCPGCGNFGILRAFNQAMVDMQLAPHQILLVSGIGQAGKFPHYTQGNMFNGLHGRPIPPATGAKIANHELNVIVFSGDGDGYGEGGNHFLAAMHRNVDLTYIVHNNQVYALTKGQAGPTTDEGYVSTTTPQGAWAPMRALALAVASDCSFVARGFAADIDHLSSLIQQGVKHKGFSLIEVLQPCVSWNHKNTYQWYKERVYKLVEEEGYDPANREAALIKGLEWGDRIPIGVIYRKERPVYEDRLAALKDMPLVKRKLDPTEFESLVDEFL
jgi:2-oxoglutarate ferredoxin oxidoreductase subunit beta